jgi:hypothetical protein
VMARTIATALALVLAWYHGVNFAQSRGFCAYCHAQIGPPPKDLNHWATCPIHPARTEVERLRDALVTATESQS